MPKSNHSSACKIAQETRWDTIVYGWMRVDPCTTYAVHCAEDVLRASEPREGLLGCLRVVVAAKEASDLGVLRIHVLLAVQGAL